MSAITYEHIQPNEKNGKALIELGREMHSESSFSELEFEPKRVLETFEWYLGDESRTAIIAWKGDNPVGLYAGYISKYYFSNDTVASDIAWFVTKKLRGTRVGLRLLDRFEEWALEKGVKEVRIGYSTNINPKAFNSLMEKRGYQVVGANYRLENKK
jgi:GNAT superfamily N-acetyltransferase